MKSKTLFGIRKDYPDLSTADILKFSIRFYMSPKGLLLLLLYILITCFLVFFFQIIHWVSPDFLKVVYGYYFTIRIVTTILLIILLGCYIYISGHMLIIFMKKKLSGEWGVGWSIRKTIDCEFSLRVAWWTLYWVGTGDINGGRPAVDN